jgi:uncharacterized protein
VERIDPSGKPFYSPGSKNKKKIKKKNGALSFSSLVAGDEHAEVHGTEITGVFRNGALEESLEEMLDTIHSIGEKIRENANYETVSKYRNAVRGFIKHVVAGALTVEAKHSSPNILRQKKFTIIKVIDQKLERLASGVLMNQHDVLDILAKIDEINGLLVNLIR